MRFQNKRVIISGGSSGIGYGAARRLAEEGAHLTLLARNQERLEAAAADLPGLKHELCVCDATDEEAVAKSLERVAKEHGSFHAAVCCAGSHEVRPLPFAKSADFENMFRSNVSSAVNVVKPFQKHAAAEGGSVVLLSSAAAIRGNAAVHTYSAAKGALLSLARAFAVELAPRKIRVNALVAGVVQTPLIDRFFAALPESQRTAIEHAHLLGTGTPRDVGAAIAFLCSDDARWITGTQMVVDGGLTCN